MKPNQPLQKNQTEQTWEEFCKEAYCGKSNSLEASHELLYYYFKRYVGMGPKEVDQLPMRRLRAWIVFMHEEQLIDNNKHFQLCEIMAKIGGLKLKK